MRTTWRKLIKEAAIARNEIIIDCTLTELELDITFNGGYGGSEGKEFTAWSKTYVYFPIVYDGAEWVGSAPRNPCNESTGHMGGE